MNNSKKILIMSDTHGNYEDIDQVIKRERPFDMFIHCGDVCGAENMLEARLSDTIVHMARGNCDYNPDLSDLKEFNIGKIKVVLLHGHRYHVDYNPASLVYLAKEKEADIVMFGHTHVPTLIREWGVTILNPGSLVRPRQADRKGTYVVMTVSDSGDCDFVFKTLSGSAYEF